MYDIAGDFERRWNEAFSDELYEKEAAEIGATFAGIKMNERINAFTEWVRENGKDIIEALKG